MTILKEVEKIKSITQIIHSPLEICYQKAEFYAIRQVKNEL